MGEKRQLTRRDFLRLSAAAATGAVVAACAPTTPVVIEREVIKEVPVEKAVIVEKEVPKEIVKEVPVEVEKPVEVIKEVVKEVEVERVVTATPKPVTGPVTVRYTHVADPGELEVRQAGVADFEERQPDIKVVAELVPEDGMAQKITTMVAGGAAPDLVYVHPSFVPLFASEEVLIPLDDFADQDPEFGADDFYEKVVGHFVWGGKTYGYPYYSGPLVTMFNKTLFDEAGVAYPSEYIEGYQEGKDEWTREKAVELALKVTTGEGAERIFGLWQAGLSLHWFNHIVWSFGGRLWDEDKTRCLLTEPEAMEAIKYVLDLYLEHNVSPLPQQQEGLPGGFQGSGRVAMRTDSIKAMVPGLSPDFEFALAPVPRGPAGRFCRDGPNATGILSTSRFIDASWEFVKYMAGPKPGDAGGMRFEFEMHRALPTRKSLYDAPAFVENLLPWEDLGIYRNASECVRDYSYPLPARYAEINRVWREYWDAILVGAMSMEEAVAEVCEEMNQLLVAT